MAQVIPAQGLWGSKLRPTAHYPDVMSHNPTIVLSPLNEHSSLPQFPRVPNMLFFRYLTPTQNTKNSVFNTVAVFSRHLSTMKYNAPRNRPRLSHCSRRLGYNWAQKRPFNPRNSQVCGSVFEYQARRDPRCRRSSVSPFGIYSRA